MSDSLTPRRIAKQLYDNYLGRCIYISIEFNNSIESEPKFSIVQVYDTDQQIFKKTKSWHTNITSGSFGSNLEKKRCFIDGCSL